MTQIPGSLSIPTIGGVPVPATGGRVVPVARADWRSQSQTPVPSFRSLVPVAATRHESVAPSTALVPVHLAPVGVADDPGIGRFEARAGVAAYRSAQALGQDGDRALVRMVL